MWPSILGPPEFSCSCTGRMVSVSGRELFLLCLQPPPPSPQLIRCFWAPGFTGKTSSTQSSSHVLSAVAFDDALVSHAGSSLATGAIVPGDAVDLSCGRCGTVFLTEFLVSGLQLRICTYIRTRLGRVEAHTSSIVLCPRCVRGTCCCSTSVFSNCSLTSCLLRWSECLDLHLDTGYLSGQSSVLADLISRRDQF